jgi:hypothetical protein
LDLDSTGHVALNLNWKAKITHKKRKKNEEMSCSEVLGVLFGMLEAFPVPQKPEVGIDTCK